ncbi:MAG: divergent polysaccharide deacetylase family protein [Pseudomonadota bacterium]
MKALAVASGIVFWTLVIGVIVLMFASGPEPAAVVSVETAPAKPASGNANSIGLPPGFAVTGPAVAPSAPRAPAPPALAPPGQGTNMVPVAPGQVPMPQAPQAPGPSGAVEDETKSVASAETAPAAEQAPSVEQASASSEDAPAAAQAPKVALASLVPGIDRSASEPLPEAPVSAVVEDSPYGPLPKVADDGARPAEIYARPSDYGAVKGGPPRVAVLLNGLGVPGATETDVIKGLPPPVSLAYGAYGRSLQESVSEARAAGHEVFLAIPLEPNDYPSTDPGPHALLTTLPPKDNIRRLQWAMSRYTGYIGVTNYMGEKFQTDLGSVAPVFEEVKRRGLLYLSDGSVDEEVAGRVATAIQLEHDAADVRLDEGRMDQQLAQLEAEAKEKGAAIGIAKAKPSTVKRIADWAGSLEDKGLVLVPVSAAVRVRQQS